MVLAAAAQSPPLTPWEPSSGQQAPYESLNMELPQPAAGAGHTSGHPSLTPPQLQRLPHSPTRPGTQLPLGRAARPGPGGQAASGWLPQPQAL